MKKALSILAIGIMMFACKKKEDAPQPSLTGNTTITTNNQDSKLIGTWLADSSKGDNDITTSVYHKKDTALGIWSCDTLFITQKLCTENIWISASKTVPPQMIGTFDNWITIKDSLLESYNGIDFNHYQYKITGNVLFLYLNSKADLGENIKYWYHKK